MHVPATAHLIDFLAVIDHGGLSSGARALGRAQAAVSYSIQSLERELGVTLFNRTARPLSPTEDGLILAAAARDVVEHISRLQAKATNLRGGIESQVSLIVDTLMPMASLIPAVASFGQQFPAVDLEVVVDAMTSPLVAVLNGTCSLGIAGPMALRSTEVTAVPLIEIQRIAVAAPFHPLADMDGPIGFEIARRHRQIIMLDRDRTSSSRASAAVADQSWRTSDIGAKREMLLAGLGWGNMPLHVIDDDLASDKLKRLPMSAELASRWSAPMPLYLIRSSRHATGIAADWLFQRATNLVNGT
ncbi:LysR family transcriptional regulator [Agrobacterium sp. NPDC090283]|uniref:LysR family transcriptional regulator n=1 Tax=Agrobacterium sp. NPDC090283 TaxID=3363920 RepID=UPI00383AB0A9